MGSPGRGHLEAVPWKGPPEGVTWKGSLGNLLKVSPVVPDGVTWGGPAEGYPGVFCRVLLEGIPC